MYLALVRGCLGLRAGMSQVGEKKRISVTKVSLFCPTPLAVVPGVELNLLLTFRCFSF